MTLENDKKLIEIITAVKYSYLSKTSKKILMLLLTINHPVQLGYLSSESGYSKPHVAHILKNLIEQKLVKKIRGTGFPKYIYTTNCNKFLDIQESLIFYKVKMMYSKDSEKIKKE